MSDLITILGPEQALVDPTLADAGLPPMIGVQSWCVFRASRDALELSDGRGWTYNHHVDMAIWKGRLYVGFNSCEKDEDVWPSRELICSSLDGAQWTPPVEMFPQGISTCLRIYFYRASNDRMLLIAGLRVDTENTDENKKGGIVVRELKADHSLGPVYLLQRAATPYEGVDGFHDLKHFTKSGDEGLVAAGEQLLADTVYLEQQDRGRLLGERRMKWHDPSAWPGGKVPGDNEKWVCGKALSFYQRKSDLVGVCKMGWVTISHDQGKTWEMPQTPPTLVTGKAKIWAQQTSDGRYALAYNPSKRARYPLIAVSGDDGEHFSGMRLVQGELPVQRYAGIFRSVGPQYTRGVSAWSDDGSRAGEQCMWLVYSMSKEDIWVSRVPLPMKPDATSFSEPWITYQPKWATVKTGEDWVELTSREPYDYASATRVLPERQSIRISFDLTVSQFGHAPLEIDGFSKFGARRLIQISVSQNGRVLINEQPLGHVVKDRLARIELQIEHLTGRFSAAFNRGEAVNAPFSAACQRSGEMLADEESKTADVEKGASLFSDQDAEKGTSLFSDQYQHTTAVDGEKSDAPFIQRLTFRTGPYRNTPSQDHIRPQTDVPVEQSSFHIHRLVINSETHP